MIPEIAEPRNRHERRACATGALRPRTVSMQEASDIIGLGMTTIVALVRDEKLRSVKVGRRRLIFLDSIDELLGAEAAA
jgi:excisionase family DNA binding protein